MTLVTRAMQRRDEHGWSIPPVVNVAQHARQWGAHERSDARKGFGWLESDIFPGKDHPMDAVGAEVAGRPFELRRASCIAHSKRRREDTSLHNAARSTTRHAPPPV